MITEAGLSTYRGAINNAALSEMSNLDRITLASDGQKARPIEMASNRAYLTMASTETIIGRLVYISQAESEQQKFLSLTEAWKKSINRISSLTSSHTSDLNYLRMIGMGPAAIPFILKEVAKEVTTGEPDHWFAALYAITGQNPVPQSDAGDIFKMARAWLRWGIEGGHIGAEAVGSSLSSSR